MQTKEKKRKNQANKAGSRNQSKFLWWGIGFAVVLFAAIAFWVSRNQTIPFEMTGGEVNPVVLLNEEGTVYYQFEYTGNKPAALERIIPRIQLYQDQVLVADVKGVSLRFNGEEIQLENGYLPDGGDVTFEPNDTFEVGVTYLGQELGWNRIYGFRLQYYQEGSLIDGELELVDNYVVYVE